MTAESESALNCLRALMRRGYPLDKIATKLRVERSTLRDLLASDTEDASRCDRHLADLRKVYGKMPLAKEAKIRFVD